MPRIRDHWGKVLGEGRPTGDDAQVNLDAVWANYWENDRAQGSDDEKRLITHYLPFVAQAADRAHSEFFGSDKDDILHDAFSGLVEAVRKWDPTKGREFHRYAPTVIRHRLIDSIRRGSHLSRRRYDQMQQVKKAVAELSQTLGHTPGTSAIAEYTGLTQDQVRKAFDDADNSRVLSLDYMAHIEVHDRATDVAEDAIEAADTDHRHARLYDALRTLNDRQKQVLALYHLEGLTLQEIATVYGVHHTRIHQILKAAQMVVRSYMESDMHD